MSLNIKTASGLERINGVRIKSSTPPEPPVDGKTRLYISLAEGRLSPVLGLGVNGSVDVDWGDGTAHGTLTGSSISTLATIPHTYSQGGDYVIILTAAEGTEMAVLGADEGSLLLTKNGTDSTMAQVYRTSLKKALLGDDITSIGFDAFFKCYSLSSITIPDSVTSIGRYAFKFCTGLTSMTIPNSIANIRAGAFMNCYGLGFIRFESTTPPVIGASGTFDGIPADCIIYVPQGTLETYTSATNYPNDNVYTYIEY